jgi:hypothetical protein
VNSIPTAPTTSDGFTMAISSAWSWAQHLRNGIDRFVRRMGGPVSNDLTTGADLGTCCQQVCYFPIQARHFFCFREALPSKGNGSAFVDFR